MASLGTCTWMIINGTAMPDAGSPPDVHCGKPSSKPDVGETAARLGSNDESPHAPTSAVSNPFGDEQPTRVVSARVLEPLRQVMQSDAEAVDRLLSLMSAHAAVLAQPTADDTSTQVGGAGHTVRAPQAQPIRRSGSPLAHEARVGHERPALRTGGQASCVSVAAMALSISLAAFTLIATASASLPAPMPSVAQPSQAARPHTQAPSKPAGQALPAAPPECDVRPEPAHTPKRRAAKVPSEPQAQAAGDSATCDRSTTSPTQETQETDLSQLDLGGLPPNPYGPLAANSPRTALP